MTWTFPTTRDARSLWCTECVVAAVLVVSAVLLMLPTQSAQADTYKCDAVDSLARLGYAGGEKVSIVGKDKVCKFSVGGASADGMAAPTDFNETRADLELLSTRPEEFVSQRLASIILESAAAFGETADFVSNTIMGDANLSSVSCASNEPVSMKNIEIRCLRFDDANIEKFQTFENDVITALLFRPTFVFEIRDTQALATAMVIFIPRP